MSSTPKPTSTASGPQPPHLEIPYEGPTWRFWAFTCLAVVATGAGVAWKLGLVSPSRLWAQPVAELATLAVDEGTIDNVVTEYGSLESSNNATIRCQVEALIGMVGGAGQQGGAAGSRTGAAGGQGGRPGGTGQSGQGGQQAQAQPPQTAAVKKKAQTSTGAASTDTAGSGSSLVTGAQPDAAGANSGSAGGSGGGGAGGTATTTSAGSAKPVIRSFTYTVPAYVPLRPKAPTQQQPVKPPIMDPNAAGGGGGRRGGGGGGGNNASTEKPGSTRIISILPEGTRVKPGDVVCELDASAFLDELQAQKIRWSQAKSLVEQAQAILDVNEITLKEYRDGIYPQDLQLVRQYLATCDVEAARADRNLEWSKQTFAKGFRTTAQVKADTATTQQAEIARSEAKGMVSRLEKYTGPRLTKNLMAKVEAIRADKLAQESVYQLESDRLRRLEEMVANCTLRAPRDGLVVYANQANRWGQTQNPIQEGVTVRQGQAIINLPDPNHMQVRAQVNESKVASIRAGQKALIRVDAFPDRPLLGTVEGVTPIPAPSGGSGQDVRVYYAIVEIDSGGFDDLRPGLSASVTFEVEAPRTVTRVPLQAVRWVEGEPFAAVPDSTPPGASQGALSYQWRRLTLGQSDTTYIEVVSGLRRGDRVVARPDKLPTPVHAVHAVAEVEAPGGPKG